MSKDKGLNGKHYLLEQGLVSALFVILLSLLGSNAFASTENNINLGLGAEINMNSRENFAGGAVLALDYNLPIFTPFAVGLNITGSNNFSGIYVLEFTALFRWYFLMVSHEKFFLQANAGANMIFEDDKINSMFTGGLRAGYRFIFDNFIYIEPYGRIGYPFAWGVGLMAGYSFRGKK